MPIRSTRNLESYYDRFSTSGAGGPPTIGSYAYLGGRGVFAAGSASIEYITISTTGNAADFGDPLTDRKWLAGNAAHDGRGVYAGGQTPQTNAIEYVTIASPGNATDFGDLVTAYWFVSCSGTANPEGRGVYGGGNPAANTIQYVTIATTGDSIDFGDLTETKNGPGAFSGD